MRARNLATLALATALSSCQDLPRSQTTEARMPAPGRPGVEEPSVPESWPPSFGFGGPVDARALASWDREVRPDGAGLPPGRGSVEEGELLYAQRCASCHGATGVEGPNDRLVGRVPAGTFPFGADPALIKTIGNYWPYATTVYDYIQRSMPYATPGFLSPDEVYGITAYLLHLNRIVPAETVLDATTLPAVTMPAHDRFVPDNRRGGPEVR